MSIIVIFDLETIPDLDALARVQGRHPIDTSGAREELGDAFPKAPFHKVVAAGFCVLKQSSTSRIYDCAWIGSLHIGRLDEPEILMKTIEILARATTIVTFNGTPFDLPVLRYRAMTHRLSAPALGRRNVFHRFGAAHVDLCDHLASFSHAAKAKLDDVAKTLDLPGKPPGVDGGSVEALVAENRFADLTAYVEADCIATAQIFLRHELFQARLDIGEHAASVARIAAYVAERASRPPLRLVQTPDGDLSNES